MYPIWLVLLLQWESRKYFYVFLPLLVFISVLIHLNLLGRSLNDSTYSITQRLCVLGFGSTVCILKDKLVHLWDVPSFPETYMLSVRWGLNLKYTCSHTYCYSRHLHIDTRKCKNTQWQVFWQVTDSYFNAIKHRMRLRGISGSSQWRCGSQSYVQASSFLGHSHKIRGCWILILLFLVAEVKHSF